MGVAHTSTVVAEQEGRATLLSDQDNVYTVLDANGNPQFVGSEVGAEFAYWREVFGVDEEEPCA